MNKTFKRFALPYFIWLIILAVVPVIMMFGLIFMDSEGISLDEATLTFANFSYLAEEAVLIGFSNSIKFAVISTIICLIIGYILAYQVFRSRFKNKFIILTIFILPMWSNLLLRTEALGNIMEANNILVDLLSRIGITFTIDIKGTELAILIGLVFTYLPFMILPIYTALEKIDPSLEEAAVDLGVTDIKKFWKVIFPMSFKGVVTGSIMVFLPCMSGFAIPEILGQGNFMFIGTLIDLNFKYVDYNYASLLAIIVLVMILGSLLIVNKVDKEGETLL
ncbi:MAG: ABC transporter permease [Bacilli bacterium]|nr:ABC transporter permease [Bacilli bacterium]